MKQEEYKSKCCKWDVENAGDDTEGTFFWRCLKCGLSCDAFINCAPCSPKEFEYNGQTVPICERHSMLANGGAVVQTEETIHPIQNKFIEIFEMLVALNPPPVVSKLDRIMYHNKCYTTTQKIIKLLK